MGNPHATFFVDDAEAVPLAELGPELERNPLFPERANIGVAQILSPERIRFRVWERGVGITQACGTGACAALVAAARRGLTGRSAEIVLDGGVLAIEWREEDGHVLMAGDVATSFTGSFDLAELAPDLA
jgi:diaminopimelate epimerase